MLFAPFELYRAEQKKLIMRRPLERANNAEAVGLSNSDRPTIYKGKLLKCQS